MKILIIDNYDSFVYNLVHYVRNLTDAQVDVYRNDKIGLEAVKEYDKIILSPGPGIPKEAGIMEDLIKKYSPSKSILGVCLGHQAIGEVFNAGLVNIKKVYHAVSSKVRVIDKEDYLFEEIPDEFEGGRYHSWMVDKNNFPESLKITALDDEDEIMALSHKDYDVKGVQFHPESILTQPGKKIISNWLQH